MRYLVTAACALALFTIAAVATAATSGAHFTNGGQPVCTDVGLNLNCTAEVAGLGNATVVATVSAQGTAVGVTCTSPGGNTAPGQNPALPVNPSGTQTIENPKNGRASLNVTTATPTVTPQQAGCPNKNWQTSISDVIFSTYTLTISQGGTTLFTCQGSFSGGSSNGDTNSPAC
jgi:hypothetical protein